MSKETGKQRLRRLMDRMKLNEKAKREFDRTIEEMPDEDAGLMAEYIEEMEKQEPGAVEEFGKGLNEASEEDVP